MKRVKLLFPLSAAALSSGVLGCSVPSYVDNQIVFGIDQSPDPVSGEMVTSAGYEMLELGSRGWRTRGLVDFDRSCWVERLDHRLGPVRVEHGTAVFRGGHLPAEGLTISAGPAGSEDVTRRGAAWSTGDLLSFESHGFAAPRIETFRMPAPPPDLEVTAPAPGAVAVPTAEDFRVAWSSGEVGPFPERVVVALRTDEAEGRGSELRCFFDRAAGQGLVPRVVLEALAEEAGPAARGTLRVAAHTQTTVRAPSSWTIYVVATSGAREQRFALGVPEAAPPGPETRSDAGASD
jgi:hypothetical protein